MIGPGFIDEMDLDICGDFFDHIDDLLDFPSEDIEGGGGVVGGGDCNAFLDIWSMPPPESLVGPCSDFSNKSSDLPTELPVPHEDIAQLEWLSTFVEDSFSAGSINLDPDFTNKDKKDDSHLFQTSSPVSVLESSSSCSGGKTMPPSPDTVVPGRARSKRPRPAIFNPRSALNLVSPTSSITDTQAPPISISELSSELENFAESHPPNIPKPDGTEQKKKKKKKKLSPPLPSSSSEGDSVQQQQQPAVAVRKCLHCEITKTPQWRAGPMGPKTLCNACGVRFKSGRLFPEYRPAASPTFVASLHSNSHKKVLEMRIKAAPETGNPMSPAPEFLPASNTHLLDYI
ncbi:zinc finger protein [Macleaya cordata]|uniref:GATA transcription factor n=1 Tax=Macleaya cordata TaxID=56857 RepID=A0A200QI79_MACCD|nr:zinc finger protein [Macleaya cordata]